MKKILLTILAVLAMTGMAMAQTAPSDINLHRNEDGSWSFIMPGRNLVMSTETFSTNDTVNGHYLGGVPEGWLILALGDTVPVSNDSLRRTTPITEGTPVTIVPTGNLRRIKSITLVDEAAAPTYTLLSAATTDDLGKVVCAAGHLHDAKTAVPDGCTAVGILGKVTSTGHGLILALQNATSQTWNTINGWNTLPPIYAGTTLKVLPGDAARGANLTSYPTLGETTVSNWAVAQKSDYEAIFINLGSTTGDSDGTTYDGNVNAYITTGVGGTALSGEYWSATGTDAHSAWNFRSDFWSHPSKANSYSVRPVLGF